MIGTESQDKIQRKNLKKSYKKIGIIEFQRNHFDYIISLHEYLYKRSYRNIRIYLGKNVHKNLLQEKALIDNHIIKKNIRIYNEKRKKSNRKILFQLFRNIIYDKLDQVYVNTIYYGLLDLTFYFILLIFTKIEIIFTIHNINYFFKYTNKKNNLKELLKKILLNYIRKKAKYFIVLNENIKKYAKEFTRKNIEVVPFKLPIKGSHIDDIMCRSILNIPNKNIVFTIPGTITNERKNISELIHIIKVVLEIRKDLIFIFLGRLIDVNLKEELYLICKKFPKNIIYFKNFVSPKDFNKYMIISDYILPVLLREYKINCNQVEKYGISKASGSEFDAYKYNKKLIIPNFYKIENPFISVKYYDNYRELLKIVLEI